MNSSPDEVPPHGDTDQTVDGSIAVHRVGAHVDGVNGYTHCDLTLLPGEVRLRLGGPLVRMFSPGLHGKTLAYRGADIIVARVRREVRWRKGALLLPSAEHRALIPLSRPAADALVCELRQSGFRVSEPEVGYFNAAAALLEELSWKQISGRRRRGRPPA